MSPPLRQPVVMSQVRAGATPSAAGSAGVATEFAKPSNTAADEYGSISAHPAGLPSRAMWLR